MAPQGTCTGKCSEAASFAPITRGLTRGLPAGQPAKSFMIRSLKQVEPDRIWLSGEAAMAGRENQGDLWVLSPGLGLQLPIVCTGFRTLSLASVQSLEHRDARLMKSALGRAWTRKWWTMCLKSGYTSSKWLNRDKSEWIGLPAKMIQWFLCVNLTPQFRACKTKGHIRTFRRYFDLLSQQGFRLLFIASTSANCSVRIRCVSCVSVWYASDTCKSIRYACCVSDAYQMRIRCVSDAYQMRIRFVSDAY